MAAPSGHPYVPERQVEYWSSRQVEEFFWDLGYECLSFPISPRAEKLIPVDFMFLPSDSFKLFGFQYKTVYRGSPDYWNLDPTQHVQLAKFSWMYYALSELRATRELRAALHALRIPTPSPPPGTVPVTSLSGPNYLRWWAFFNRLRTCQLGLPVSTREAFLEAFAPILDSPLARREADNAADVFLLNMATPRIVRFTNLLPLTPQ